jgi:hypothetical protein
VEERDALSGALLARIHGIFVSKWGCL